MLLIQVKENMELTKSTLEEQHTQPEDEIISEDEAEKDVADDHTEVPVPANPQLPEKQPVEGITSETSLNSDARGEYQ